MRVQFLSSCLFFLTSLSPAQQATAPSSSAAEQEKKLGMIEGRVVDARTGEPVRKANLMLMVTPGVAGLGGNMPQPTAAATDQEGKFSFTRLEPGRYALAAEKPGYVRAQYGQRSSVFGPGTLLSLEAGQRLGGIDFKLMPQAVITGKVLDEDGEPVQHAMVSVMREMPMSRQPMNLMGMGTNDAGEFRIANLPPGGYLIRVEHRGSMMGMGAVAATGSGPSGQTGAKAGEPLTGYLPTFYPGVTDAASATPVTVAAGQQVNGIDIRLRKGAVYRVSGKIVGLPPGSERVQITLQPQKLRGGMMGFGGGGTPKSDGTFILPSVQSGSWRATVLSYENGRPQMVGSAPVEVTNAHVEGIVIQAGKPMDVAGRVAVEAGKQGAPKLSGSVILQPVQPTPHFVQPARIGEDGTFRMTGVPRDAFRFQVVGLPQELYVKSVRAGTVDITESGLDLSRIEAAPPLEIQLSTRGASVEGVAVDGEKPAAGALVLLLPHPFKPEARTMLPKTANSDQQGRFTIQGIAPGEYRAYALDSYFPFNELDEEQFKKFEPLSTLLRLKEEGRERVELKLAHVGQP